MTSGITWAELEARFKAIHQFHGLRLDWSRNSNPETGSSTERYQIAGSGEGKREFEILAEAAYRKLCKTLSRPITGNPVEYWGAYIADSGKNLSDFLIEQGVTHAGFVVENIQRATMHDPQFESARACFILRELDEPLEERNPRSHLVANSRNLLEENTQSLPVKLDAESADQTQIYESEPVFIRLPETSWNGTNKQIYVEAHVGRASLDRFIKGEAGKDTNSKVHRALAALRLKFVGPKSKKPNP